MGTLEAVAASYVLLRGSELLRTPTSVVIDGSLGVLSDGCFFMDVYRMSGLNFCPLFSGESGFGFYILKFRF